MCIDALFKYKQLKRNFIITKSDCFYPSFLPVIFKPYHPAAPTNDLDIKNMNAKEREFFDAIVAM